MYKNLFRKKYILLMVILVMIGFIINMPLFTKNILTADVLLNTTYYNAYSWELSLGRFGLFILGIVKSYLVIPHIELFLCLLIIGAITILLIELLDIKNKYLMFLVGFVLLISPNISTTLLFNYCSFAYIFAFFMSVFSIYTLFKIKNVKWKYIISGISLILALSIYQSYIQVTITLFLLMVLKNLLEKRINIKELMCYMITICISLVCYFVIMKLSLVLFHIDMSTYSGANKFGITNILNIPREVINTYITFYNYFFNDKILNNTYLLNNVINLFLLALFIIILIYKSIKSNFQFKDYLLLILIILSLPVSINCILLIIPNTSMQLLMSSSYILLLIFLIYLIRSLRFSKYILIILLLILSRNFIIESCSTLKTLEITYNKTYKIASNILDNINDYGYKSKVMITGNLDNNDYYNDTNNNALHSLKKLNYGFISNKSLFWDEYTNIKNGWTRFFYEHLGVDLNFVTEEEYNNILETVLFKEMLSYPNKGSIRKIDDVIVIKIN